jgi:hypothetical protein
LIGNDPDQHVVRSGAHVVFLPQVVKARFRNAHEVAHHVFVAGLDDVGRDRVGIVARGPDVDLNSFTRRRREQAELVAVESRLHSAALSSGIAGLVGRLRLVVATVRGAASGERRSENHYD